MNSIQLSFIDIIHMVPYVLPFVGILDERRHRADLDGVGVVGWVLKESVVWVKQLPGQQEEKLPRRATVVQPGKGVMLNY